MPSEVSSIRPACLSSRRSTTRSPWPEGSVETRTSTARPAMRRRNSAVLRQTPLRDVELGHDLDSRYHQRRDRALGLQHLAQHAVDAETDDQAVLVGLDMDVRGVLLDRLRQQGIDQPDDRRLVVAFEQVRGFGNVLGEMREVGVVVQTLRASASPRRTRPRRRCAAGSRISRPTPARVSTARRRSGAPRRAPAG